MLIGVDLTSLVLRALSFVTMLQAAGLAFFMKIFAARMAMMPALTVTLRKWLRTSAALALVLVVTQQGLQAARMSGEWQGMLDMNLQHLAWFSSTGTATVMRMLGLLLLIIGTRIAWVGAVMICISFALVGHTSMHVQRVWLAPLLTLHLLIATCWFGALMPLYLASRNESPMRVSKLTMSFSRHAVWSVPLIAVAGLVMALLLLPDWQALSQPYGRLLMAKFFGFALLMVLAALNKWRWGLQLDTAEPTVHKAFQRSVLAEYVLLIMILLITAVMTGWFSPD